MVFQVLSQRCRGGEWLGQYYIGGTEGVHTEQRIQHQRSLINGIHQRADGCCVRSAMIALVVSSSLSLRAYWARRVYSPSPAVGQQTWGKLSMVGRVNIQSQGSWALYLLFSVRAVDKRDKAEESQSVLKGLKVKATSWDFQRGVRFSFNSSSLTVEIMNVSESRGWKWHQWHFMMIS